MRRLHPILTVILLLVGFGPAKAQFAVYDAANSYLNNTQVVKQLQQLEQMVRQINTMKAQLSTARKTYKRQIDNLKQLPDADWNSMRDTRRNLNRVNNAAQNMAYMNGYIENRYKDLYDTSQRLLRIQQNPEMLNEVDDARYDHMKTQARELMATAEENLKNNETAYDDLDDAKRELNYEDLTPQQARQIQAKVQALSSQQLIEMKRIIAQHAAFAARQARMEQEEEKDQHELIRKANQDYDRQFREWKQNMKTEGRSAVPSHAKGGNHE